MTIVEPQGSFGSGFDEFNQDSDDEEDWFSTDSNDQLREKAATYETSKTPQIQTAANLFSDHQDEPPPVKRFPPDQFQQGMLITHPEYGAGKIVALSGQGKKRTATVEFFNGEEKKFRLAQSPLHPAVDF